MTLGTTTILEVCEADVLRPKLLLASSGRVGNQWIESLVRNGQNVVNLQATTVLRLAIDFVGSELAKDGLTLAGRPVGPLVIDANWELLSPEGYFGRLQGSPSLFSTVYESLLSLRLAGAVAADHDESHFESAAKAKDIAILLNSYEDFLKAHSLVDEADVLRLAIARLDDEPVFIDRQTLILLPQGIHVTGLEHDFLKAIPSAQKVGVRHPAVQSSSTTDLQLLAHIGRDIADVQPKNDGTVQFFRAVGEINEVRDVFRRCLAEEQPLDNVELLHTDSGTYVPLIYATASRYFSETGRKEGIPITFAEGIPAILSRPGRALAAWLRWIKEDYPQRLLVDMIGDGLLDGGDDDLSFGYLVRVLRPIAIGFGAEKYLPKLDEQIKSARQAQADAEKDDSENANKIAALKRRLSALQTLRKLVKQLLNLASDVVSKTGPSALVAAEKFLTKLARSVSELDQYTSEALIQQIQDHQIWLEHLNVTLDVGDWLGGLPAQTRVLGSGPRPGHIHVAHIGSGGHSGRKQTYVVGLDDRRFPGAALQDPIFLDGERRELSPELSTSAARLRHRIEELPLMLSRLSGSLTLSWPCYDLQDDRENFPCSVLMSAYRLISGCHDADLESLNNAVGRPVSFAPTSADKALDESERWLWRLSDQKIQGTNQIPLVESHFPHLEHGSAAQLARATDFGPFNGYVPQAGNALNPFSDDSPVLSASSLETAGRCPLAFFFRNGLKLSAPDELEIDPDRWINPAQFGSLMHDVFRQFMDELTKDSQLPEFDRDHVRLAKILREAIEQWREDVPPPNENAFRMQYWQLVETSRIFLKSEEAFCKTSQPRYFEVALGVKSVEDGTDLDDEDHITVTLPGGKSIKARGWIDRVDESGASRYTIWDYKTGGGFGYDQADPFRQGRRVQSVLYLQMIETAIRKTLDKHARVERFGYFFPSTRAQGLRIHWSADDLADGLAILERLCASIEEGAFLATDNESDCHFCDYVSICRDVTCVAGQSKDLLDQGDLVQLRHIRELRRD